MAKKLSVRSYMNKVKKNNPIGSYKLGRKTKSKKFKEIIG